MTSENERGFDIEDGTIRFRRGHMRRIGQGGLLVEVQVVWLGFGVGVDVKLLRGGAEGVGKQGRAVASAAEGTVRTQGCRVGARGGGVCTCWRC